jgi:gamma-glutamyltranspeptidase/glutathione hydrolase
VILRMTPVRRFSFFRHLPLAAGLCLLIAGLARGIAEEPPQWKRFAVSTVHPLASQAAVSTFEKGGNAVDAAIAAALTLGVVDGHNSGIGGGCFILIRASDERITCLDGRETAPISSHRDMFVRDGAVDHQASVTGPLAAGVPGALKAYEAALLHHGKMQLEQILRPAADLAETGFPIDEVLASRIAAVRADLARFPASRAIFLAPDGTAWPKGHVLRQRDLAETYRQIAEHGCGWFYEGDFAIRTERWMRSNGGILTAKDFASYRAVEREPLRTEYRGHQIVGMPPPSSGGVHVAQILGLTEALPSGSGAARRMHWMAESMKLAFADRAHWLGDPDFTGVPKGLVAPSYLASLAKKIDPQRVVEVERHGLPPHWEGDIFGKHTTHLCTADSEGNWVALTQTINTTFGSKVVVPGTGVILNNEMDDFSTQPGVPNAFGLVGTEANSIAPRKRPLSSMSPTLVLKDNQPVLATGAAGGPTIITQVALVISGVLELGLDPVKALEQPRFHHQWRPDRLKIEASVDPESIKALQAMGHTVAKTGRFGACQIILKHASSGELWPAHDPRVPGASMGR